MNCKQARNLLSTADEGRLSDARAEELDAHVSGCDDCRAARGLQKRLIAATGQLEAMEPRPGLAARITAQALAAEPAKSLADRWTDWVRGAWPVAALGTAAAIALLVFYPAPEAGPAASDTDEDAAFAGLVDEDIDDGATLLALEDAVLPLED